MSEAAQVLDAYLVDDLTNIVLGYMKDGTIA
jgi:hypothetical protein